MTILYFNQILSFIYVDDVAKDLLPIHLAKFVPLIILTDEQCIHSVASIRFVGNTSLALELRTIS